MTKEQQENMERLASDKPRELDCGDNSCWFKEQGPGGMRTNGGCRCFDRSRSRIEIRRRLAERDELRATIERLHQELDDTKDALYEALERGEGGK